MRATGPQHSLGGDTELPLGELKIQLGQRVHPRRLLHGTSEGEIGYFRRLILHEMVRRYAGWEAKNPKYSGHATEGRAPRALNPGHKDAIRRTMRLVDTAESAEVRGISFITSQNETHVANQCYCGKGGSGFSGSTIYAEVLWRGTQTEEDGRVNKVAVAFKVKWSQHHVLEAARALANPDKPFEIVGYKFNGTELDVPFQRGPDTLVYVDMHAKRTW